MGIKKNIFNEVKEIITILFKKKNNENKINTKYSIVTQIYRIVFEVFIFINCAMLYYRGKITLTFFMAMTYYVYRYTWLIENFQGLSKSYQKTKVAVNRFK